MKAWTIFVAAIHGINAFTAKLIDSPEFQALEKAGTPVAEAAVTAALAPEIGPLAPLAAGAAVVGAEDAIKLAATALATPSGQGAPSPSPAQDDPIKS